MIFLQKLIIFKIYFLPPQDDFEALEEKLLKQRDRKEREKESRGRGGRRKREEALDPMDPASYSDIPRWGMF